MNHDNIKFLNLSWEATLLRYYLMMFAVIAGVLSGVWAIAFLGLPIFLSAIMGISIGGETKEIKGAKLVKMTSSQKEGRQRQEQKIS